MPIAKFSKNCLANVYSRTFRFALVKRDRKLLVPRVIFFLSYAITAIAPLKMKFIVRLVTSIVPKKKKVHPFAAIDLSTIFDRHCSISLCHTTVFDRYLSLDKVRVMETMTTLAAR